MKTLEPFSKFDKTSCLFDEKNSDETRSHVVTSKMYYPRKAFF